MTKFIYAMPTTGKTHAAMMLRREGYKVLEIDPIIEMFKDRKEFSEIFPANKKEIEEMVNHLLGYYDYDYFFTSILEMSENIGFRFDQGFVRNAEDLKYQMDTRGQHNFSEDDFQDWTNNDDFDYLHFYCEKHYVLQRNEFLLDYVGERVELSYDQLDHTKFDMSLPNKQD